MSIPADDLAGRVVERIPRSASAFGVLPDGREAKIFTISNRCGLQARVSDYGAALLSLMVPDRHGRLADVTLGFEDFTDWLDNAPYFGVSIGRFGNRIRGGRFRLDGREHTLATNHEAGGRPCHLHGGIRGFSKALWRAAQTASDTVRFDHFSPDGDEGYPGNLQARITYTLNDDNELIWQAEASTDAATIINLVHHTYWNLSGNPGAPATAHELTLHAHHFLPTCAGLIPTGEIAPVAGTAMDFRTPRIVGERIEDDYGPLRVAGGYDHCWVLDGGRGIKSAAVLRDPVSGRRMELFTDQPGVQFYAGNFIEPGTPGKNGIAYPRRAGMCLESQRFPDSPNRPEFPSCVLRPGEIYRHVMIHRFSADRHGSAIAS